MARTMQTQRRSELRRSSRPTVELARGDWIDVMDTYGTWNVARVLSVPSPGQVEITYDGWPREFDEVVRIDSPRVAPYHTFTWAVKCWVKYLNWPMWPAVITIRTPGTEEGIVNLMKEKRVHVDFFDHQDFEHRDRCWQARQRGRLQAFDENYDEARAGTNGFLFEQSLRRALLSDASAEMPVFIKGMLPAGYAKTTTMSVDEKRREMGDERWHENFLTSRQRHYQTHIYKDIGGSSVKHEKEVNHDTITGEFEPGDNTKPEEFVVPGGLEVPRPKKKRLKPVKAKRKTVNVKKKPVKIETSPDVSAASAEEAAINLEDDNESVVSLSMERGKESSKGKRSKSALALLKDTSSVAVEIGKANKHATIVEQDINTACQRALVELMQPEVSANSEDTNERQSRKLRQRAFVMRADKGVVGIKATDSTTKKEKFSKRTLISIPRKFPNGVPRKLPNLKDADEKLSPPSNVFSSSHKFSIDSWFKSKFATVTS